MAYCEGNLDGAAWFQHESCYWILGEYLADYVADCPATLADFALLDKGKVPPSMDPACAAKCTAFMRALRAELTAGSIDIYKVYDLCEQLD